MKVLHTADWHLGQKFYHKSREKEHAAALNWLSQYIQSENIELLIIAGDIFDTDMPPNYARKLYFNFLKSLINTCCENIVIVAGNHDSPNMLEASKDLFELLNIFVVGHINKEIQDEVIEIRNRQQELKAVVAAVPFLRDKDIRRSVNGQSAEDRMQAIKDGICIHYAEIAEAVQPYSEAGVPIIATGHLYAAGGERSKDRNNRIHIGSLGLIEAQHFSPVFDYVALGHLHRAQIVGDQERIRYSGSLIPLDFSEMNILQSVTLIDFDGKTINNIHKEPVKLIRKLRHYIGDLEKIRQKLQDLDETVEEDIWLKLDVEMEEYYPNLLDDLKGLIENKPAEIFTVRQNNPKQFQEEELEDFDNLNDLTEEDVFVRCVQHHGIQAENKVKELTDSFKELMTWMQERDQE